MSEAAVATPAAPAAAPSTPAPAAPAVAPATPAPAPSGNGLFADPAGGTNPAPAQTAKSSGFFRDDYATEGKFKEGWSKALEDAGFQRLASRAMTAKDEASLFRMLDDAIGHASGKRVTRPTEGAADQDVQDFRRLVGAPNAPEEYGFKPPKVPDGLEWDDESAAAFQQLAHKHHVPAEFMKEASEFYLGVAQKQQQQAQTRMAAKIDELAAASEKRFRKEKGDDYEGFLGANRDFITARKLDLGDPILKAALSHPDIVALVDEARRASREAPIPGIDKEVFNGSGSAKQQAQAIMRQDPNWKRDPVKAARVKDLYAQDAAREKRTRR